MSKPPADVVAKVARRMVHDTGCTKADARDVVRYVLENIMTDELIALGASHGEELLRVERRPLHHLPGGGTPQHAND